MCRKGIISYSIWQKKSEGKIIRFKSTDYWMESRDLRCKSNTSCCQYGPEQPAKCSAAPDSVMGLRSASALRRRRKLHPHVRTQLPPAFSLTAYSLFSFCVTSCTVNELCLVAFQQRSDVFIKYRRKKAANLFQDLLLSLSAGGWLVFCLEHGKGRAALLAVRPLITHPQRRTAAHMRRSSCH